MNGVKLRIKKLWSVLDFRGPETTAYSLVVFVTSDNLFAFCKVIGSGWVDGTAAGLPETILKSGEKNLGNQAVLRYAEDYVSMLQKKSCAINVVVSY